MWWILIKYFVVIVSWDQMLWRSTSNNPKQGIDTLIYPVYCHYLDYEIMFCAQWQQFYIT